MIGLRALRLAVGGYRLEVRGQAVVLNDRLFPVQAGPIAVLRALARHPGRVLSCAEIRRAIAEGEARSGERLPPARDLAAVLGVNANTVFRALRTLRDEGLVEFRRGRGVSVTGIAPERSPVVTKARELVAVARPLTPDYFVVLALAPEGNIGRARYELRVATPKLVAQL